MRSTSVSPSSARAWVAMPPSMRAARVTAAAGLRNMEPPVDPCQNTGKGQGALPGRGLRRRNADRGQGALDPNLVRLFFLLFPERGDDARLGLVEGGILFGVLIEQ